MQQLTEHAYKTNDNVAVTFIVHSMGGRMLLCFLQQMPQEWIGVYVKRIIALSVPWAGSVQSIMAMSIGYNPFPPLFFPTKHDMKTLQQTFSSLAWLMPEDGFWTSTEVLANVGSKNYTVKNIDQFF